MLKRYPHTATIVVETVGEGPLPETTTVEIPTVGRYEPAGQNKKLDQVAKFFCPVLDILKTDPFALTGQKAIIGGRTIDIINAFNYQTHSELWLD